MVLLEGTMTIGKGDGAKTLQPGGYAYLPAKEPQYLACGAQSRYALYVYWDSDSKSHPANEPRQSWSDGCLVRLEHDPKTRKLEYSAERVFVGAFKC
jgi:glyoxylate utilization-related uncharacterized protein